MATIDNAIHTEEFEIYPQRYRKDDLVSLRLSGENYKISSAHWVSHRKVWTYRLKDSSGDMLPRAVGEGEIKKFRAPRSHKFHKTAAETKPPESKGSLDATRQLKTAEQSEPSEPSVLATYPAMIEHSEEGKQAEEIQPSSKVNDVTTVLWEDERISCFQVEARGLIVLRRADNDFVNGTRLLEVAGMTQRQQRFFLQGEKVQHVVETGPIHFRAINIPQDPTSQSTATCESSKRSRYTLPSVQDIAHLTHIPNKNSVLTSLSQISDSKVPILDPIEIVQAKGAVIDDTAAFTDSRYASSTFGAGLPLRKSSQDDVRDLYSFGSDAEAEKIHYQLGFVSEILKVLQTARIDEEALNNISLVLPDTLKSFALRLQYDASGEYDASKEKDYDTMFFIYFVLRYRSDIASILIDRWRKNQQTMDRLESNQVSSNERVQIWQEIQAYFDPMELQDNAPLAEKANFMKQEDNLDTFKHQTHSLELPREISVHLDFLTTTPAYSWLLSNLANLLRLSVPQPNTISDLRDTIRSRFPVPTQINRQTSRVMHKMTITINWQLAHFLDTYDFDGGHGSEHVLKTFVTLTSDGRHVQALKALQYLQQTWPQIGETVLDLVIKIVQNGQASTEFQGCILEGKMFGAYFVFVIIGSADFIAETGEILSWMGAVFRPSPKEGVVYECTPSVNNFKYQESNLFLDIYTSKSCTIEYSLIEAGTSLAHCWHGLFQYAVVAHGFPIMKRSNSVEGLEMSLGMMLALCRARHIGQYNGKIIIKGFSSMFSLSEHKPGISTWHLTGNMDGSFIPYPRTKDGIEFGDLGVQEILRDRHFVGWCSQFIYGPGSLDIAHQAQPSCLSRAQPGCYLFGVSLRRGHAFPVEPVCIAHNQQSPHVTIVQDLHRKLERIHAKPVVLWDTANQRGWLTNGTSALLHLTLASVEKGDNPFASTYDLRKADITQRETNTENAAAYILLDERNLRLQIRSHLGQPVYLQDRVEDILYLLDLMMDQQTVALEKNNSSSSLGMLEGWDFRDVVNAAPDILHPRTFMLDKDCSGWLQLLKDTYAVTLFGEDFGELYKPLNSDLCKEWTTLPLDRCYLAASVADLEKVAQVYGGNNRSVPQKLTVNTVWPVIQRTFENCACFGSSNHSDLVQILVPSSTFTTQPNIKGILRDIPHGGAVIFGPITDPTWLHPNYFPISMKPSRKRLQRDNDSDPNDSGLGDSISSAPTETWSPKHTDYHVAIVCALPRELFSVRCLFDEIYSAPEFDKLDNNSYAFGRIFSCKVVAACLHGTYGTNSAAQVIVELKRSFPLKFCLLVGIAGGIPSSKNDIRLGDVVVSRPSGNHSGLIKYDFEKVMQGGASHLLGSFNHPPQALLSAIGILESDPHCREPLAFYIEKIGRDHPTYRYPGADLDILYASDHIHTEACINCGTLERNPRKSTQPRIHYGLVASGDKLIKDAKIRDEIGSKYNALCFEMEGAGIANVLPSLIVRGISDYSDSQKNDTWQEYASATAAAYAKLILGKVRPLGNT